MKTIVAAGERLMVCPHFEQVLGAPCPGQMFRFSGDFKDEQMPLRFFLIDPPRFHKHQPVNKIAVCRACCAANIDDPVRACTRVKLIVTGSIACEGILYKPVNTEAQGNA